MVSSNVAIFTGSRLRPSQVPVWTGLNPPAIIHGFLGEENMTGCGFRAAFRFARAAAVGINVAFGRRNQVGRRGTMPMGVYV